MAEEKYFFYLSFENSICVDYVTEKFFNAMNYNIIPVVFGGTDYDKSAGAPPHSYINAYKDFKNPADLAKYMKSLMDSPEKYAEYFWWKDYYRSDTSESIRAGLGFCDLCEKLHTDHGTKIYHDLDDWWIKKAKCERFSMEWKLIVLSRLKFVHFNGHPIVNFLIFMMWIDFFLYCHSAKNNPNLV